MMNYELFKEEVVEKVSALVEDAKEVKINKVVKNNDLQLDGLVIISPNVTVAPTIYLNSLFDDYKAGVSLNTIVDKILDIYRNAEIPEFAKNADDYTKYDFVKERLAIKAINYEKNKKMLKDVPYVRRLDLAIIYLCVIDKGDKESASIMIRNSHLKFWGIDEGTLFTDAISNAPKFLKANAYSLFGTVYGNPKMESMEIADVELDDDDLLILTNENKVDGASCIFYPSVIETISNKLDSDLYIIPSSIHEVLILRKTDNIKREDLDNLINTVNHSGLSSTEILSNHVYIYDRDDKILTM